MIGTPPPTLASKPTARPRLPAARKISPPCSASNALLPVTTSLPAASACMISLRAGSMTAEQLDHDIDVGAGDERRAIARDKFAVRPWQCQA